jgi:hypothetical protein
MIWVIASIPFWIVGAFFMVGSVATFTEREPQETSRQLAIQCLGSLILAGIFFLIAAKICS